MSLVQLPDELQQVIERVVAEGRAASQAAFLEEAVRRLVDEAGAEEDELRRTVEAGAADAQAGRHTMVAGPDDERRLHDALMARLRGRLSAGG